MRFLTNPPTLLSARLDSTRLDEVQSVVETMRASSVQIPFATLQRARVGVDARRAKQYHQRGGQRFQPKHARTLRTFTATARASEGIETTEYFSPSKINLFLRVTARRPDGFHDLASLFHVIDWGLHEFCKVVERNQGYVDL